MAKKKKGPIETLCEEVSTGTWRFSTGHYFWQYRDGLGLNLSVKIKDDEEFPPVGLLYAKNLDHAVMFAHGYEAGSGRHRAPDSTKKGG